MIPEGNAPKGRNSPSLPRVDAFDGQVLVRTMLAGVLAIWHVPTLEPALVDRHAPPQAIFHRYCDRQVPISWHCRRPPLLTLVTVEVRSRRVAGNSGCLGWVAEQRMNLKVQPTNQIRPGYRFNLVVAQDRIFSSAYRLKAQSLSVAQPRYQKSFAFRRFLS